MKTDLDLYYELADSGKWEDALLQLKKLVIAEEHYSWFHSKVAECHYELKDYDSAIDEANIALSNAPLYPLALWVLGNSQYCVDREVQAAETFGKIVSMSDSLIGEIETGMGRKWSASLRMDAAFRASDSYYIVNNTEFSIHYYRIFLSLRKEGVESCLLPQYIEFHSDRVSELL